MRSYFVSIAAAGLTLGPPLVPQDVDEHDLAPTQVSISEVARHPNRLILTPYMLASRLID